jgi:hypothetical protein
VNYVAACQLAKQQSLPTSGDPKGCCTKYVEATLLPSLHDPLVVALTTMVSLPGLDPTGYTTTDWYSGACVACYHDGRWRDLR